MCLGELTVVRGAMYEERFFKQQPTVEANSDGGKEMVVIATARGVYGCGGYSTMVREFLQCLISIRLHMLLEKTCQEINKTY